MGAENNQPESALLADYYDPDTDSAVKFENGAQNEEGGDLVENPSDALNGADSADVQGPGPDHMVFKDDGENTSTLNDHVNATSDPMGNTEEAERKSGSGVTAYAVDGSSADGSKGGKK